jgi:hypothetical protein
VGEDPKEFRPERFLKNGDDREVVYDRGVHGSVRFGLD